MGFWCDLADRSWTHSSTLRANHVNPLLLMQTKIPLGTREALQLHLQPQASQAPTFTASLEITPWHRQHQDPLRFWDVLPHLRRFPVQTLALWAAPSHIPASTQHRGTATARVRQPRLRTKAQAANSALWLRGYSSNDQKSTVANTHLSGFAATLTPLLNQQGQRHDS